MSVTALPISQIKAWTDIWPRLGANEERVALFADLYKANEHLPAIEVVSNKDGTYLIADGVHRFFANKWAGRESIDVVVIEPNPGENPSACAYRRALETATQAALPLTTAERHRAALRLHEHDPSLSHRAIARLVGVSHNSVGRWISQAEDEGPTPEDNSGFPPRVTADDVARRLVLTLARLDESRSLFDMLNGARMGRHLARAFDDRLGDDALRQAQRFAEWTADAVAELKSAAQG
jgi:hypothetical protein